MTKLSDRYQCDRCEQVFEGRPFNERTNSIQAGIYQNTERKRDIVIINFKCVKTYCKGCMLAILKEAIEDYEGR